MPTEEIVALLNAQQGLNMNPVEVALQKEEYYYEILHQLEAVPEVLEEIHRMHGEIPFAVVSGGDAGVGDEVRWRRWVFWTGSRRWYAPRIMRKASLIRSPYLTAAKRLGVAPEECLVFEDTAIGIQAAMAAGMASVKILQP